MGLGELGDYIFDKPNGVTAVYRKPPKLLPAKWEEAMSDQTQQKAQRAAERARSAMENDYEPNTFPGHNVATDLRVAHSLEYIAYQLGQINRNLARVADKLDAKS